MKRLPQIIQDQLVEEILACVKTPSRDRVIDCDVTWVEWEERTMAAELEDEKGLLTAEVRSLEDNISVDPIHLTNFLSMATIGFYSLNGENLLRVTGFYEGHWLAVDFLPKNV